jgi:hypothetical protein
MTSRLSTAYPFTCVTCEAEIVGHATFYVGLPFCCAGCVAGGPCTCSYDGEAADDARIRHCLDVGGLAERDEETARIPTLASSGRSS